MAVTGLQQRQAAVAEAAALLRSLAALTGSSYRRTRELATAALEQLSAGASVGEEPRDLSHCAFDAQGNRRDPAVRDACVRQALGLDPFPNIPSGRPNEPGLDTPFLDPIDFLPGARIVKGARAASKVLKIGAPAAIAAAAKGGGGRVVKGALKKIASLLALGALGYGVGKGLGKFAVPMIVVGVALLVLWRKDGKA